MQLKKNSFSEIEDHLYNFRRLPGVADTNYFHQTLTGTDYWSASGDRSFIFLTDDLDFLRLYFVTKDPADLKNLLSRVSFPQKTITALVSRRVQSDIEEAFFANGHREHALFRRMFTRSLRVAKTNSWLDFAAPEDLDELLLRLKKDFDPYPNHLPSRLMLADYIANQWVLVIREDRRIVGYIVFQIIGNQVNYNFLYYAGNHPGELLFMQNNFFGLMVKKNIRAGFLWVDETNIRVIKMNEASGWKFDGLMTKYLITHPTI